MKALHTRFVKNWISSLVGLAIIIIGMIMYYQTKIDTTAALEFIGFGMTVAAIKYKRKDENQQSGN